MCVQVPCVYLLYAASTVTIRNTKIFRTILLTARLKTLFEFLPFYQKPQAQSWKSFWKYTCINGFRKPLETFWINLWKIINVNDFLKTVDIGTRGFKRLFYETKGFLNYLTNKNWTLEHQRLSGTFSELLRKYEIKNV